MAIQTNGITVMNSKQPIVLVVPKNTTPEAQCDCACADINYNDTHNIDTSWADFNSSPSNYIFNPNITIKKHDDDYYALYGKNSDFTVINKPAKNLLSPFIKQNNQTITLPNYSNNDQSTLKKLIQANTLVNKQTYAKEQTNKKTHETIKELSIWLHITDQCNLRCEYCYLPHEKKDMDFATGKQAIDVSIQSALKHNISKLKIKFAGGEAMIFFPLVLQLAQYAKQQTEKHHLDLDSVILSNGTLFNLANLTAIKDNNIRLMVSLDGLDEYNQQRCTVTGKNSFQRVEHSLNLIQSLDIPVDISLTISGKSVAGLADLTKYLLERDLVFSYNFYRENDHSMSFEDLQLEETNIIKGVLAAFKVIENNLPDRSLLASLLDRGNLSASHHKTCAVGQNYMVFDYQGNIAKCQMQLSHKVSSIHAIDPLTEIRIDKTGIQNIDVDNKENCNSCQWRYWCTGGCPLTTYRATGRYDLNSPNCHIYKAIYPEVIRLETLRLLKSEGITYS